MPARTAQYWFVSTDLNTTSLNSSRTPIASNQCVIPPPTLIPLPALSPVRSNVYPPLRNGVFRMLDLGKCTLALTDRAPQPDSLTLARCNSPPIPNLCCISASPPPPNSTRGQKVLP